MGFLDLTGVEKFYGVAHVVKGVNMEIEEGEFVSFLGPSGCGKTTTLRMIAGFETLSGGTIAIAGNDVGRLRPNQRNIGMVFQSYALFPNMTVAQNVGFGLKVAHVDRATISTRVTEMLGLVGLGDLGGRFPFQLSGGQQQRVALARALAGKPQLLLLDEPLSALDAKIRVSLREEIRRIQKDLGITTIYVTHDQEEALSMSDRIVVMRAGVVEQIGTPVEIYSHPATAFVSTFVGQVSRFTVTVTDPATGRVRLNEQDLDIGRDLPARAGEEIELSLRPEMISPGVKDDGITLTGVVADVSFLGSVVRIRLRLGDQDLSVDTFNDPSDPPPKVGQTWQVGFNPANLLVVR
jgi:putative spermidine/putrescine transport system ATP-binding protein